MTRSGVTVLVKQSIYSSFSTKHPDFISSDLCPPNSPVDHRIWRLKQECVYIVQDTCPWHLRLDAAHHWHMGKHHRLRGSASTVLTATGQVNACGWWRTLTPHRIETHDCEKIRHNWLGLWQDALSQIWYKSVHWVFWANGWNIPFCALLFIPFFFWASRRAYRSDRLMDLRAIAQKTWNHARMCLFGL